MALIITVLIDLAMLLASCHSERRFLARRILRFLGLTTVFFSTEKTKPG
jgi:hypothetical protein